MNQGKLDVNKRELTRLNINILGKSELKWIGMDKFNSDDHYIYYCGKNHLEEIQYPSWSTKESKMPILGCNLKNDRMISVRFQGKSFKITVIRVYVPTTNAEEAEVEWFYRDL